MKTSELIERLKSITETYGDVDIHIEHEANDLIYIHTFPGLMVVLSKDGQS